MDLGGRIFFLILATTVLLTSCYMVYPKTALYGATLKQSTHIWLGKVQCLVVKCNMDLGDILHNENADVLL